MSVEFFGGPIDGTKEHPMYGAANAIWLIAVRSEHFAVYVRKQRPDGKVIYEYDRMVGEKEAKALRETHETKDGYNPFK